jgi:flagellar protein FlaG
MVNSLAAVGEAQATPPSSASGTDAAKAAIAKATVPAEPAPEPSPAQVKQAARQIEGFMQSMNRYLEFRIDQDSGRTVVTVKDKTSGEVIRQIPAEEVLRLAQNLGGKGGALVDQSA